MLNRLASLCCAHSLCISSLSSLFLINFTLEYVFCLTSSSLWRQWSFRFSPHLIFSFLSGPSIQLPLLVSSCNEPGSPHSSLPWVCIWEQKYASHLKMTSSFYATANQRQAHGTLPLWTHYVDKTGRRRDKNQTNCKIQLPIWVALYDCVALVSDTESVTLFIQCLS